ncbi:unnamed protein product [Calypogeia fissa]
MKKVALPSSSCIPVYEDSLRKRRLNNEDTAVGDAAAAATPKKAREDRTGGGREQRVTRSFANSSRKGGGGGEERNNNAEVLDREAREIPRERSFSWERQAANQPQQEPKQQQQQEERQETREATQEVSAFDAEAAVKKLSQTKEHFAELCRNYLANYKTQGADVSFPLSSSTLRSPDSRNTTCPEREWTFEERNAAFSAAARPAFPSTSQQQPPLECECGRMPSDSDVERYASVSAAACPPPLSNTFKPAPECRRMPTNFDAFFESSGLQLVCDPSSMPYRATLRQLESRALQVLNSVHRKEQQVEKGNMGGGGHGECDGTIVCKARAFLDDDDDDEDDTLEISQFRSYQLAFKAAAVAEILRLQQDLIKSRLESPKLPRDDALGKAFFAQGELVKRLKSENESAAKELAQLRAEKTASEQSLAEIQVVKLQLESQISTCTCRNISSGNKIEPTTRSITALSELKSPELDGVIKQQQCQQDGRNARGSRLKAMGGCQAGVSAEQEARLEGICETSVEQEVVSLVAEKLDEVKADMGVFVKILQSRIAGIAGQINSDESRVRPVRVGLFCLKFLIQKLLEKKAEIEASLVEKSADNRLGLKLHFRG